MTLRALVRLLLLVGLLFAARLDVCVGTANAGPVSATPPWRFMVIGDSRGSWFMEPINTAIMTELKAEILRVKPAFVFVSGDLVYSGNQADFQTWRDLLADVYDAGIAVYPVMGNHDASDPDGFKAVFGGDIPDNGPPGETDLTYFVAHENALVLALDYYDSPTVINMPWVNSVLDANTRPHVFAIGHMPAFKVAHTDCLDNYPQLRDKFWDTLKAAGGRAYFAGHDHFYDHMRVDDGDGNEDNDLHQIIVGTAGAPLYGDAPYDGDNGPWTPTRILHEPNYGYVLVEIENRDATLTWYHRASPGLYLARDLWSYTAVPPVRIHVERLAASPPLLHLWFTGEEDALYDVEASSDLVNWDWVGTFMITGGTAGFNYNPSWDGARFFRVRQ